MGEVTHHQPCSYKKKRKHRATWSSIQNNINICNSNTNNNINKNNNIKKHYCEECLPEKIPPPVSSCCHNPHVHHHCIPRRGELVINGGFENVSDPFFGWVINSGVEDIDPSTGDIPHQGLNAATIGYPNPCALLYQDVPGICPELFYQLNFYMSAATKCGNASVNVRMEFLDHGKNLLDGPALDILIPKDSLSNEVFTGFNNSTHVAAPPDTKFARISFEINAKEHRDRFVHLDDVSLIVI